METYKATAKLVAVFLLVVGVVFGIVQGAARLDLLLNPWLRGVDFRWVMLLTTHHCPTLLLLHRPTAFHLFAGGFGGLVALLILLRVWKES